MLYLIEKLNIMSVSLSNPPEDYELEGLLNDLTGKVDEIVERINEIMILELNR